MNSHEILSEGAAIISRRPKLGTLQNIVNIRIAARLTWESEEMGGIEHVQFAYRNRTPIVPIGHCCHPLELVKRGYVDGKGWPDVKKEHQIKIHRWFDGKHYYPYVDGKEVIENGREKWSTSSAAEAAAKRYIDKLK